MDKVYLTNIFIIDWDDTLFPTNWVTKNNIDITNPESYNKYKLFFIELDNILSNVINSLNKLGNVFIVSNASLTWIKNCLPILPYTNKLITAFGINIISARDNYINKNSIDFNSEKGSIIKWKITCFQDILVNVLNSLAGSKFNEKNYLNIISIGDANFEYVALINLDDFFKINKLDINYLLKNIKFIEKPEFNIVIEQLAVLRKNIQMIVDKLHFVDLNLVLN
jgi:hypothetical protein